MAASDRLPSPCVALPDPSVPGRRPCGSEGIARLACVAGMAWAAVVPAAASGMEAHEPAPHPGRAAARALARLPLRLSEHEAAARPVILSRGESVRLVLAEGRLTIETPAVALEDGALGALVKVKPGRGGDAVIGRLVAPGLVQAGER